MRMIRNSLALPFYLVGAALVVLSGAIYGTDIKRFWQFFFYDIGSWWGI